ncbi:MAG: SMI1/KNR4 family protein [Phycisphaerae bacterium]|jgi:hypothetical protein
MQSDLKQRQRALKAFETRFECDLPATYKAFLLANCPWHKREHEITSIPDKRFAVVEVREPFRLIRKRGRSVVYDLLETNEIIKGRTEAVFPPQAIAIGHTTTDEDICLFIAGRRKGQIWMKGWLTIEYHDRDDWRDDLFKLARSFDEFLELVGEPSPLDRK